MKQNKEITEGWIQDQNKFYLIRKKASAASAIGYALSNPTKNTLKTAYGFICDYSSYLVHSGNDDNEKRLASYRKNLGEIGIVIFGSPKEKSTQDIYKKYNVERIIISRGIYREETYRNLMQLVLELQKVFEGLAEYAQDTGFGSAKAQIKLYGKDRALELSGLTEDEIGD